VQLLPDCGAVYDPHDKHGLLWGDLGFDIDWGISNPLLSQKDYQYFPLVKLPAHFLPQYPRT